MFLRVSKGKENLVLKIGQTSWWVENCINIFNTYLLMLHVHVCFTLKITKDYTKHIIQTVNCLLKSIHIHSATSLLSKSYDSRSIYQSGH